MDRSPMSSTVLCSEWKKPMKCMANVHKRGSAEPQYKMDGGTSLWLRLRLKSHILDIHTSGFMALNNALCSLALNDIDFLIHTHHLRSLWLDMDITPQEWALDTKIRHMRSATYWNDPETCDFTYDSFFKCQFICMIWSIWSVIVFTKFIVLSQLWFFKKCFVMYKCDGFF